jgi:hypothetical protein
MHYTMFLHWWFHSLSFQLSNINNANQGLRIHLIKYEFQAESRHVVAIFSIIQLLIHINNPIILINVIVLCVRA